MKKQLIPFLIGVLAIAVGVVMLVLENNKLAKKCDDLLNGRDPEAEPEPEDYDDNPEFDDQPEIKPEPKKKKEKPAPVMEVVSLEPVKPEDNGTIIDASKI